MNPFFKPDPPLSNETRNEIYKLYKKDAVTYTPRKLGETFKISIARITAILRMKTLEDEWKKVWIL
jgi:hypothetical protein